MRSKKSVLSNQTVTPPEEPPILPPTPDKVIGKFEILKYDEIDETILLDGAQFEVYRAAKENDADPDIILCGGMQYAVVPVAVDGEKLVLTTAEIPNQRGNILPETGGIGTTWFWGIGGAMTITAAVLLITRKRMSAFE